MEKHPTVKIHTRGTLLVGTASRVTVVQYSRFESKCKATALMLHSSHETFADPCASVTLHCGNDDEWDETSPQDDGNSGSRETAEAFATTDTENAGASFHAHMSAQCVTANQIDLMGQSSTPPEDFEKHVEVDQCHKTTRKLRKTQQEDETCTKCPDTENG